MSTVTGGQGNIITNGLVLNLDAANPRSYPQPYNGTAWRNLVPVSSSLAGSLVNGVGYTGSNGGALVFDGTNDFIELGDVLDLGTNSMTVIQWVKLNTVSVPQSLLSKALAGAQDYRFSVGISFLSPTNRLIAFMFGSGGFDITPYGSTNLTTNTWFMASYVFDRTSSIKIYYNGVQETLTGNATISQWAGLNFQSPNPFRIGSYTAANNTGILQLINGNMALTQVYHRALSASEVLQNFNATRARFGV